MEQYLSIAKSIALEAAEVMLQYFDIGVKHSTKDDNTPLTEADEKINQLVLQKLEQNFPDHSLLGEEGNKLKNSKLVWVFDPIDGTIPFLRGVPISVFSIALVEDGEPILGVVYDPYTKRMYHAIKGQGAFLNDVKISTSKHTDLENSYIEYDGHRGFKNLDFLEILKSKNARFLSYGCIIYAHMMVATGQLEAAIFPLPKPWDSASAKIIVEEAGGVTSDLYGNHQRYDKDVKGFISAGNKTFHKKFVELVSNSI